MVSGTDFCSEARLWPSVNQLVTVVAFKRVLVACGIIGLIAGCAALSTGPDVSSVSGHYRLEAVDGQPLPVAVSNDACPVEIFEGDLDLDPEVSNRRALYITIAYGRLRCDPLRILMGESRRPLFDMGRWNLEGDRIEFQSNEGRGDYSVTAQGPSPTGLPGPTLIIEAGGRQYRFRRDRLYGSRP